MGKIGGVIAGIGSVMLVPAGGDRARASVLQEVYRDERVELVSDASGGPAGVFYEREVGRAGSGGQLRSKRLTRFTSAQEEIIELETEWEQLWHFRFLQYAVTVLVLPTVGISAAGMGKLFEAWTKAQEEAEREEEIKLTGTYSNPATVRKENPDDDEGKGTEGDSGSTGTEGTEGTEGTDSSPKAPDASGGPSAPGGEPKTGDGAPPGGSLEPDDEARRRLEKLYGTS